MDRESRIRRVREPAPRWARGWPLYAADRGDFYHGLLLVWIGLCIAAAFAMGAVALL